jgi:uncharacterized membrane protein YccC
MLQALRWPRSADPGHFALKSAARAAIVMPCVFAFATYVIDNPQTSQYAAFGSFAMLVLADFGGARRPRIGAYLLLTVAGAVLIVLGTLCSRDPSLAAGAMAVVGFAILFSGVINGYFAAGGTAAMLTFILPVTLAADASVIPDRLVGWSLAAGAGIVAHLVLWPSRPPDRLRAGVASAARALADLVAATVADDAEDVIVERAQTADEAIDAVHRSFLATPYRPTGPTDTAEALAMLVDELAWFRSFVLPATTEDPAPRAAVVEALRASATTLDGGRDRPDLDALEAIHATVTRGLEHRVGELAPVDDEAELLPALDGSFRLLALLRSASEIGRNALLATGAAPAGPTTTLHATEQVAAEHASPRSLWFRNSVRGAAALAVSVLVAQESGLQHSFWVVLGTLSVLRSSALGTGATIVSALVGTSVGIVVGALVVIAIGTDTGVLWAVLPVAVLLAAYAPRVMSFGAGQAGFTLVLLVLFNILQPVGWSVGLVRVEDVAIGFAISLAFGLLFWPRGASSLIRNSLAAAYEAAADHVRTTVELLVGSGSPSDVEVASRAASAAASRLDAAFRQYLAERSAPRADLAGVGTLVAGTARLRRTALTLDSMPLISRVTPRACAGSRALEDDMRAVHRWYERLGSALRAGADPPPPSQRDGTDAQVRLVQEARDAVAADDPVGIRYAFALLWAGRHLDNLWRLQPRLVDPAAALASGRGPSADPGPATTDGTWLPPPPRHPAAPASPASSRPSTSSA